MTRSSFILGSTLLIALVVMLAHAQGPSITMTVILHPMVDVFQMQAQQYTLTNTPAPNTTLLVYVNGLLMCSCEDYVIEDKTITFTGQTIGEAPVVQVLYWTT